MRRVAVVEFNVPPRDWFVAEFAKHGLVDGRTLELVMVPAKPEADYVGSFRRAVELRPDVIYLHFGGRELRTQLLPLSRETPLVVVGADVAGEDSIEGMNRRGDNVTGAVYSYVELVTIRLELMKQLRPGAKRFTVIFPSRPGELPPWAAEARRREDEQWHAIGRKLGIEFVPVKVERYNDPDEAIPKLRGARIDLVEYAWGAEPALWDALARNGIAASAVGRYRAEKGALLAGWTAGFHTAAVRLAARILNGVKASSLPVERAREFGLAINMRTARTLGIEIPQSLLLRADAVFDK